MIIEVKVTSEELNEMGFDDLSLTDHIIETLDGDVKELVGYNVKVVIDEVIPANHLITGASISELPR